MHYIILFLIKPVFMTLGERASAIAKEKGLNQKVIAERMGIGPVMLNRYFNNMQIPSAIVAGKIAQELGVSLDYLVLGKMEEVHDGTTSLNLQLFEKLSQIDKELVYTVIEALFAKTRLKEILGE